MRISISRRRRTASSDPPRRRLSCRNVIVTGAALVGGTAPRSKENTKGYIRGFDVRTGKRVWTFHTIPQPGEFGNDTWLNDSWSYTGNTARLVAVLGRRRARLRVSAGRIGDRRLSTAATVPATTSLPAASSASTPGPASAIWHQQLVHHDIWDYDLASPPTLINITVNGKPIRAVAQVTKWGFLFVFDRVNGQPVWPIEERPVEAGTVPGEWYSPTQPFPTKPAPYDRQGVQRTDLIDFTPELNAEAREMLKEYKIGPLFTPPIVAGTNGLRGTLQIPGSARVRRCGRARRGIPKRTCSMCRRSPTCRTIAAAGRRRSDMNFIGGGGGGGGGRGAARWRVRVPPEAGAGAGRGRGRGRRAAAAVAAAAERRRRARRRARGQRRCSVRA